jgi:hypothetical protein
VPEHVALIPVDFETDDVAGVLAARGFGIHIDRVRRVPAGVSYYDLMLYEYDGSIEALDAPRAEGLVRAHSCVKKPGVKAGCHG